MPIRLIDTKTLQMKVFLGQSVPKYAILSHTWVEDEEIDFQEMTAIGSDRNHPAIQKSGYRKIYKFCEKARRHRIKYGWVDTCSIDKSSSAELSEAINSMFKWYQDAEVCYALLSDFQCNVDINSALPSCRWFTRGWTLQELIAPKVLRFYDNDWNFLGTKGDLKSQIQSITNIDEDVLEDCSALSEVLICRRMSWASQRVTTRIEDVAYCLMGIFDINMPLLYGEGNKAFMRLQEEIIRRSNDLSIFWNFSTSSDSNEKVTKLGGIEDSQSSTQTANWYVPTQTGASQTVRGEPLQNSSYRNIFATSPTDFPPSTQLDGNVRKFHLNGIQEFPDFAMTNKGIRFENVRWRFVESPAGSGNLLYAICLGCTSQATYSDCLMILQMIGPGLFARREFPGARLPDFWPLFPVPRETVHIATNITPSIRKQIDVAHNAVIRIDVNRNNMAKNLSWRGPGIENPTPRMNWNSAGQEFLTFGKPLTAYVLLRPYDLLQSHLKNLNQKSYGKTRYCHLAIALDSFEYNGILSLRVKLMRPDLLENHGVLSEAEAMDEVYHMVGAGPACPEHQQDVLILDGVTVRATVVEADDHSYPRYRVVIEATANEQPIEPSTTEEQVGSRHTSGNSIKFTTTSNRKRKT